MSCHRRRTLRCDRKHISYILPISYDMCSIRVRTTWSLVALVILSCPDVGWVAGHPTATSRQTHESHFQPRPPTQRTTSAQGRAQPRQEIQKLQSEAQSRHLTPEDSDGAASVELSGTVDATGVTVWLQDEKIYSAHNNTRKWAGEVRRFHAGVHVVVLHERRSTVMLHDHFLTWQPAASKMLYRMVDSVQDGRIILFLGAPEFTSWLQDKGTLALMNLGSQLGVFATLGEAWAFVAHKGHAPIAETLITSRNSTAKDVSPLTFSVTIPLFHEKRCPWYQEPALATKATFCETYEGYKDFCHCHHPLHLHPHTAPLMQLEEVIPVALVTAKRFPMVMRQVQQLWENPGGRQTPLAILVDGYDPQAEVLARLLNLTVRFHDNPVPRGTKHRVNEHIRFSLETIFQIYPEVDKAIILEDDLSLAPDFISYFQQTSSLMNVDKTVLCVNAYSYNAFPHTASDPRRIHRVQSYPYYGWMTSRTHARKLLSNWAPLDIDADWDLYTRQYHVDMMHEVIIPEVPRTRHEGGGGVHVTGLDQETTYDQRPLNTLRNVTLNMRRHWHLAYALDRMVTIKQATVVNITKHPCREAPVPKYQPHTTYVIYMSITGEEDPENSYTVLGKCLGFYYKNLFENYHGTFSLKFFQTPVILVACWSSAYCDGIPANVIYKPTKMAIKYAKRHPWRHSNATAEMIWRIPPRTPQEEFYLINIGGMEVQLNE